jgi:hypothetical protein
MNTENVARFTAQRVADAVIHAYGPTVQVEVLSGPAGLYYSVKLVSSDEKPLMLSCSTTTMEQVFWNVSRLIDPSA